MATLRDIRKAARDAGAIIEVSPERCGICDERVKHLTITSPAGMQWAGNGCHVLCGRFFVGDTADEADCASDLIEQMSYGVEPCDDPECDHCHPCEE